MARRSNALKPPPVTNVLRTPAYLSVSPSWIFGNELLLFYFVLTHIF
jgi:hypothetical protein